MSLENKIDSIIEKTSENDKNIAILIERMSSLIEKFEDNNEEYEELKKQAKEELSLIKQDFEKLNAKIKQIEDDTKNNSRVVKIINAITWLFFTSTIGLAFFYIKEKIK